MRQLTELQNQPPVEKRKVVDLIRSADTYLANYRSKLKIWLSGDKQLEEKRILHRASQTNDVEWLKTKIPDLVNWKPTWETTVVTEPNDLAILCRKKEDWEKCYNKLLEMGYKPRNGFEYYWNKYPETLCFSLNNGFMFGSMKWHQSLNKEILSASDFL